MATLSRSFQNFRVRLYKALGGVNLTKWRPWLALDVAEDPRDDGGNSVLHWAAYFGRMADLEYLLVLGASVHSVNHGGATPLHAASSGGHVACIRALIVAGADVNRASDRGNTPFSGALFKNKRRALKILLHAGADVHIGAHEHNDTDTDAWALVDAIRKVGDWPNYVRRRRAIFASVIEKAITRDALPHDINLEIAAFVEPPGGY